MCAVCGSLGGPASWSEEPRETTTRERLVGRILATEQLSLRPWQGGGYIVVRRDGASELAPSLSAIWAVAERASGRPADPLDPRLLDALARGTKAS